MRSEPRRGARHYARGRRRARRVNLLLLLMGLLCGVAGAAVFAASFTMENARMRLLGLVYAVAAAVLLAVRWVVVQAQNIAEARRRAVRGESLASPPTRAAARPLGGEPAGEPAVPARPDEGMVLVVVLLLVALMTALSMQAQVLAAFSLRAARSRLAGAQVRWAAEDAAWAALDRLGRDETGPAAAGSAGAPERVRLPSGIETATAMVDENSGFDLNNLLEAGTEPARRPAAGIVLEILTLRGADRPAALAAALQGWLRREGPLPARSSLLCVEGFSRAMLRQTGRGKSEEAGGLDPCLTALPPAAGRPRCVNINTAPPDVLLGLFGADSVEQVRRLVAQRAIEPFRSVDDLVGLWDPAPLMLVAPYLAVRSEFFTVTATANRAGVRSMVSALARRDGQGGLRVLSWVRD